MQTAKEAIQAASDLGYPVAVKPSNANKGIGVSLGQSNAAGVEASFQTARRHASIVLVERMIPGLDHRLLVVGGRFVAASNRRPGGVVGDGRSSVCELVTATNSDPRRGPHPWNHFGLLELDDEALALLRAQDMTPDSVVPPGAKILLRRLAFLPEGGSALDVTDRIHPDNKAMAELAARVVGLDVAGIDFVTPDIGQSWRTGAGAICEVNAMPSFRPHLAADGNPPDVAGPMVELMFPSGTPARVPLAVIVAGDTQPVADGLERLLAAAGHTVGRASPRGVTVGGDSVRQVRGHLDPLETAVYHPDVDAAVLETTAAALAREGLSVDRCRVAAIFDSGDGAEALSPIERQGIGFLVRATEGPVVLAADEGAALLPEGTREVWEASKVTAEMAERDGSFNEADAALRIAALVARGMGVAEDRLFRILEDMAT